MFAATSHRYLVFCGALAAYAAVFAAFVFFEIPGLGVAHFYYLPVAAFAMTGGPRRGFLAGVAADALYGIGILLNPTIPPAEIVSASTGIRLVTFTAMGMLVGWFAAHNRDLVGRLQLLAERDHLTGLPNTRAFESALAKRLQAGRPFCLILGDMDGLKRINDVRGHTAGNDALRTLAEVLAASLRPEDELARVGGDEFALLTSLGSEEDAGRLCLRLEGLLAGQGAEISFGWALFPAECENALTLYRAADERLYERKVARGQAGRGAQIVALRS